MSHPKLLVLGLDCATPQFLFDSDFDLPHLHALRARGVHGVLRSCDPPITVPAWSCMTTGADPGVLGCFGFRNRMDHSYAPMRVATSLAVRTPRVWDLLGKAGYESILLGVPQTYPPRPIRGHLVSGLLTPSTDVEYTHPPELATEILEACGGYRIDVPNFRTDALDELIVELNALRDNRFAIAEHLIATKPWDFFMMVEIGLDRLHHALWRFADPAHPGHVSGHKYGAAFRDYYENLDAAIGRLIARVPTDTGILVVSDHGAKPIYGAVRINQWLIDEGYLALKSAATEPHALEWDEIDWPRTQAFSSGGYYARIFLNVKGREPEGIVSASEVYALKKELTERLRAMPLPRTEVSNVVLDPAETYAELNGVAPDLLVYFGDLHYRGVGTVGTESVFADGNDTGPDEANHAREGIYVFADPSSNAPGSHPASIYDVAPTILDWFTLPASTWMHGESFLRRV